jgi:hypothetical protein
MPILTSGYDKTETVTEQEFETLSDLLKLLRNENQPYWLKEFVIYHLAMYGKVGRRVTLVEFIDMALEEYNTDSHEDGPRLDDALLFQSDNRLLTPVSKDEHQKIQALLAVLRSRCWLSGFIRSVIQRFQDGERQTPQDIIEGLVESAESFVVNVDDAKALMSDYSKLFADEIARLASPAAQEPLAPGEAPQTSKPAKKRAKTAA